MIDFTSFCEHLKIKLDQPLPGAKAHELLMPEERKAMLKQMPDMDKARRAAVLMLVYPEKGQPHLVFIERSKYEGVHSGQIAFPGGQHELHDKDFHITALRETEEEIGITQDNIEIIGDLSEIYIPPSNYLVLPVLAKLDHKPEFIPDKTEVENVITFPVEAFLKEDAMQTESIHIDGKLSVNVPCYNVEGYIIWGATSMMLSELLNLLNS